MFRKKSKQELAVVQNLANSVFPYTLSSALSLSHTLTQRKKKSLYFCLFLFNQRFNKLRGANYKAGHEARKETKHLRKVRYVLCIVTCPSETMNGEQVTFSKKRKES